jgi:hypothetical protein
VTTLAPYLVLGCGIPVPWKRGTPLIARRKTRTLLLTVALIVGLLTVAIPVCTTGACNLAGGLSSGGASPTGSMAGGAMTSDTMTAGAMSHDGMSPGVMAKVGAPKQATTMSRVSTTVLRAVCGMATMTAGVVQHALPPSSPTLLIGLILALAVGLVSMLPRLTTFSLPVLATGSPAPPGDLRGVCLLI